jgi:MFS family permease
MPSFLYRKFGMSLGAAGFSSTAYLQIASVLGVITGGVLADRFARRHRGGRMITQAIGLLAGVPFIFVTGWTLSVPVLILAMAGFGYFKGLYDANIWASLHDVVPADRRATGDCAGRAALRHERVHQRQFRHLPGCRSAASVGDCEIHEGRPCVSCSSYCWE